MARRLDSPVAPRRFLASDDAAFLGGLRRAAARVDSGRAFASPARFERGVARAIERRNIAGLCDPEKHNWYGVDVEDVARGAHKLGLTPERVAYSLRSAIVGSTLTARRDGT
jgi:hypothetical protein